MPVNSDIGATAEIRGLTAYSTPTIANAIETFNVRGRQEGNLRGVRALFHELGPFVGHAVTAEIRAERLHATSKRSRAFDWWDYILSVPPPRVVVMQDLDDEPGSGAYWGEVQSNIHRSLGCVAVVTNGSVRDLDEVRALGFQMAAMHVSPSHANIHLVNFGSAVKVGGVWIQPGDLVHGDHHGVVTVPPDITAKLPAAIGRIEQEERAIISYCQAESFTVDGLKSVFREVRPTAY